MHSSDDFSMADYRALAEIRYQIRRFLHFSEETAREAGLVPQQHQLLLALKGLPDGRKATIGELAEHYSFDIIVPSSWLIGWWSEVSSNVCGMEPISGASLST